MGLGLFLVVVSLLFLCRGFASPNPSRLNNISINIYLYYLLFSLVGAFIIYFSDTAFDLPSREISESTKLVGLLVIVFSFSVYVLSIFVLVNFFKGGQGDVYNDFVGKEIGSDNRRTVLFVNVSLALCLVYVFYDVVTQGSPLSNLIRGVSVVDIYQMRIAGFSKSTAHFALEKLFRELSIIVFLYSLVANVSKTFKMLAIFSTLFLMFSQTEKGPVIFLAISSMFIVSLKSHKKEFGKLLVLGFLSFVLLIVMFVFLYDLNVESAINNILSRVFIQQISGVFLSIQLFGDKLDFDYGYNLFPKIWSVFTGETRLIIAERLALEYLPGLYSSGGVKNINGLYVMDAWASFGLVGCLIVSCVLSFYAVFLYFFFLSKRKVPIVMAFYTYFSVFNVSFINSAGISVFSPFAVLFLIIFSLIYYRVK